MPSRLSDKDAMKLSKEDSMKFVNKDVMLRLAIATRVGHAYAEHAVHADYAHMREYAWRGVPGSVINSECPKYHFCSSHLVLSILRNEK